MSQYKLVGIDLSKHAFQVCALNRNNKEVFNKTLTRKAFEKWIHQLPEHSWVAMEACGTSNYWGRKLQALGHRVTLIPAQYVKPFVKRHKNDAADALAICEAAQRPGIHPVPVKTQSQLDMQMVHRVRQRGIKNKTALANQIRALLREYGISFAVSMPQLLKQVPLILEDADNGLSTFARELVHDLYEEIRQQIQRIEALDRRLKQWIPQQPEAELLLDHSRLRPGDRHCLVGGDRQRVAIQARPTDGGLDGAHAAAYRHRRENHHAEYQQGR